MKKLLLYLPLFCLTCPIVTTAQELIEYTHPRTGIIIQKTSWSEIKTQTRNTSQHMRLLSSASGDYVLNMKIMIMPDAPPIAFTVDEGKELWLKLINGEVIKLENTEKIRSGIGHGTLKLKGSEMHGGDLYYSGLTEETIDKLSQYPVVKFRIHTDKGYHDAFLNADGIKTLRQMARTINVPVVEMADQGF